MRRKATERGAALDTRCLRSAALLATLLCAAVVAAPAASAHPLGNFTVNYSSTVVVEPQAVRVDAVVDRAEISTLQAFPDSRPGEQPPNAADFMRTECAAIAAGAQLAADGQRVPLRVTATRLQLLAGAAGLATSRLECTLRTTADVATVGSTITYVAAPSAGRIGWHEVVARGDGVGLAGSDVPHVSPSDQLRAYPADLLSSPLDQRTARLSVVAGTGVVTGQVDGGDDAGNGVLHGLDRLTTQYTALVSRTTVTPGFAVLAVLLSLLLGALHAFAPGHGKTLMAAYLVGREGTWRQAAVIGLSVTVTHTIGVLVLGAVLSAAVLASPSSVYPWLGLISGLLLAGVGVTLLRSPGRLLGGHEHGPDDGTGHGHGHGHGHGDGHGHGQPADLAPDLTPVLAMAAPAKAPEDLTSVPVLDDDSVHRDEHGHGHGHGQGHGDGHGEGHGEGQGHGHGAGDHGGRPAGASALGGRAGTARLAAVGLVGGMVPSPSALLVLLGGIALGRAWFGALLVLAYGIGMAAALVATGLLLVAARDRVEAWSMRRASRRAQPSGGAALAARIVRVLPRLTAVVVILVGLSLAVRSALTI